MTAKTTILLPGHRVTVRNAPVGKKTVADPLIVLAPGDTLAVTTAAAPPPVDPPPPPPPGPGAAEVTSIPALLAARADLTLTEIVLRDGPYRVSPIGEMKPDSLWLRGVGRTEAKPVLIRAETPGGVILDMGGRGPGPFRWWREGAAWETWDGFTLANGVLEKIGADMFGERVPAVHHIALPRTKVLASVKSHSSLGPHDHAAYFSSDVHHVIYEDFDIDGANLDSAFHFFHAPAATDILIRRGIIRGTEQAIMLGDANQRVTFEDVRIENARKYAVAYWNGQVTFRRVVSVGSGVKGFMSYAGANPPGVTQEACSWG